MVKKVIAGIVALTTMALCFAGCGNDGGYVAKQGSPVKVNGDAVYPIECEDTLTYWMVLSSTVSSHYSNFGETPLAKEVEKRTGIKVTYEHPEGNGAEQLQLLIASGDLADIVGNDWNNFPGGPQMAIDEKIILDLTDLIDKYAPALKKKLSENEKNDKLVKTDNGKYYAFPFMLEEGILQVFYGPIVRKDWLTKVGMSAPETIDEWEAVLTVFKDKCGATAPYAGNADNILATFSSGFNTFNGWYLDGGKVKYGPYTPEFKDLLAKMHDWYQKGLIDNDFAVLDGNKITSNILRGVSGAQIGYAVGTIGDNLKAGKNIPSFDLLGVNYPATSKGGIPEYSRLASTVNMSCGVGLSTNCKNPELAARFLDYGYTEEGHNLYNFGIEGESYNWIDGYPKYSDFIMNNPDGWTMTDAMGAYMRSGYNGIMVQDTRYIEQYYSLPQQKEAQKTWQNTNMAEHMLPQIYVARDNMDKDSEIMANVKTYSEEMISKFITGALSIDEFDNYLAQLKNLGMEDAIKFRQEAYENYLKR